MSFPQYERYKDSGVECMGRVPEHWEVRRLKSLLVEPLMYGANEAAIDDDPSNPRFVRITDIDSGGDLRDETFRSLPMAISKPYLLTEGDILLARSGATVGKSFIYRSSWGQCCFAGYLIRARVRHDLASAAFIFAYLQSNMYWQFISSEQIQSTIQNVSAERYNSLPVPTPPVDEQIVIARFLSSETAKIDALVEEQRRLIELLKEKRQAVISHAVTKGLNPVAPMKNSGIEWLGDVPEHWGRKRKLLDFAAKQQHSFVNGPFGSDLLTGELVNDGFPVIYVRDIKAKGYSRVSEWCVTPEKATQLRFCNVIPGDILVAKVGDPPGIAAVYPEGEPEAIVTQDVIRLRVDREKVNAEYIKWLLNSKYGQTLIDDISVDSTRTRVGLGEYKQLRFFVPPLLEQQAIATYLVNETTRLDALITEATSAIDLLQERRSALISAAVTGKIDVGSLVCTEVA